MWFSPRMDNGDHSSTLWFFTAFSDSSITGQLLSVWLSFAGDKKGTERMEASNAKRGKDVKNISKIRFAAIWIIKAMETNVTRQAVSPFGGLVCRWWNSFTLVNFVQKFISNSWFSWQLFRYTPSLTKTVSRPLTPSHIRRHLGPSHQHSFRVSYLIFIIKSLANKWLLW